MKIKLLLPILFLSCFANAQGTWVQKTSLPAAGRLTAVAFTIGTKGYLGIGEIALSTYTDDFWEYDPIANSWTQKANFSGGNRGYSVGFSIGNKGYIVSGATNPVIYFNDLWEYNPVTNLWSQLASFGGTARSNACGFSLGGFGYLGGGWNAGPLQDFWKYNPISNSWTQLGNFVGGVRNDIDRACFAIGNKAYWGTGNNFTTSTFYNDFWEYDPITDSWTQKANLPAPGRAGAVGFSICTKGYLGLGVDNWGNPANFYNDLWMYDPVANSWSAASSFPGTARADQPVFVVNNKAYLGTGYFGQNFLLNDFWEFTPSAGNSASVTASSSTICQGQTATLTASGTLNYTWNPGGQTTATISVSPSITTTYTVTTTDSCGSDTSTATINVLQPVNASINGNVTMCSGQSIVLTASGGTNYSWNTGATTISISVSPSSSTSYSVVVSNVCSSDIASSAVTVLTPPVISFSGNTILCTGDSTTLTVSGGINYSWSNGSTSASINVSPATNTTYYIVASNGLCSITDSIIVSVSSPPNASLSGATICAGQSTILIATGGGNYSWSSGDATSLINISPTSSSTYSVIVSIGSCSDTASATVIVNPSPVVIAYSNTTITTGQSATLTASGSGNYLWSNGATDSINIASPNTTTLYCVTVINSFGCFDTACVLITVKDVDCSIAATGDFFIPNAFSPNGDGENETVKLQYGNMACIDTYKFAIYNRWGEKVFETENPLDEWDGKYKGKFEPNDVFTWYMKVELINGEKIIRKGNISVLY